MCDFLPPTNYSIPGFSVLHYLLEFAQTHIHWIGDAIQPSHPLSPPSLPALSFSQNQGLFQWVSSSDQCPKYWSFSFSISPSNEYSGLISFRINWFELLSVQGTLKSLFQHHSSKAKASVLLLLSLLYGPTLTSVHDCWKNHSYDYMTYVCKAMSLLLNMLSRFAIAFLPRSKCLSLIMWLKSLSAVTLEAKKKVKYLTFLLIISQ